MGDSKDNGVSTALVWWRRLGSVAVLAALVSLGCNSHKPAKRLTFDELSEHEREGIEAFREGGERWKQTLVEANNDERLARFLAENLAVELVRRYESGALSRSGATLSPYERVRRALGQLGAPAAELLANMVAEGDDVVAGVGADALAPFGTVAIEHALVLAGDSRVNVRRRAFDLVARIAPQSAAEEARIALAQRHAIESDTEWVVRAEAVRSVARRIAPGPATDSTTSVLLRGLQDSDPTVVGRSADGLAVLGDPRAVPGLIESIDRMSGDLGAFDRIQRALRTLLKEPKNLTREQWWQRWTQQREALLAPLQKGAPGAVP